MYLLTSVHDQAVLVLLIFCEFVGVNNSVI